MDGVIETGDLSRRRFSKAVAVAALLLGVEPLIYPWLTNAAPAGRDTIPKGTEEVTMPTIETIGLDATLEAMRLALLAMRNGDPEPFIDTVAPSGDVTLFGAWGPIEHGYQPLVDTFRWVGSRFTGGTLEVENTVVQMSGDLAYTVGFERGDASVDGGPSAPMTIRVTHIYRRIDGDWRLVHRHADFPPPDQRQGMR